MATEKKITSRIQQKHDVAANWAKATNFIPKKGEIIIYDAEYNASGEETQAVRFKIGDGSKTVNNLPFAVIDGIQKISGEFYFLRTEDGSIVGINDRGVMIMSKPNNPSLFIVGKEGDMDLYAALMVQSSGDLTSPSTITIGLGEPTVVQLEGEAGSAKQVFTSQGNGATPKWTSVVNSLNGNTGDITGIATTSQLNNKQDKITSSNKLSSSLVDGLGAAAAKAVDTAISANSTSTNLPTSKAVEDRINAHSGIDKVGTITGIKMNSVSKGTSGVVDLGTVLTDASKFATAAQGSNADSALTKANANATEISNIKNGTTKVKSAEHADTADSATSAGTATKATEAMNVTENIKGHAIADIFESDGTTVKKATSAGTADKVANGLTIANATFDGSKPLTIGTSGEHIEIMGGSAASPNRVSIGLKYGNLMPSSYNKVTVDGYGFVIDGENVNYLTSHQSIKSINTNNTAAQDANASEAIVGSGTINLHKVAKTGSYNDLLYKPTIPAAANNGTLTIQKNGTKVATFTANQSTNTTANITVPIKVSELTNDSGYTTNKGTVTSISIKMNGASKGTVTSSGTIDLGTVITSHQNISGKLDKTTYEVNKTIDFGSSGVLYVGKFKVYDTNVTCEVTSTTNVTYSGKLVIATQNYAIAQMTVYGDAANTVAPNFYVKPSSESNPYIEVYFKPSSWSKNVVHIYGSNIQAEPTNVCTNVPSVPSTATLKPKNALPIYSLSGTTLTITL